MVLTAAVEKFVQKFVHFWSIRLLNFFANDSRLVFFGGFRNNVAAFSSKSDLKLLKGE